MQKYKKIPEFSLLTFPHLSCVSLNPGMFHVSNNVNSQEKSLHLTLASAGSGFFVLYGTRKNQRALVISVSLAKFTLSSFILPLIGIRW